MIRIRLDARGIANIRFAISPLTELVGLLALVAGRRAPHELAATWSAVAQSALRSRRLPILSALAAPGYLPDFLTPEPLGARSFEEELALVAATPARRVRAEVAVLSQGRQRAGLEGRPMPQPVRDAFDDGEHALLDATCAELRTFWDATIGPSWPRLRVALSTEMSRVSSAQAARGTGGILAALHEDIGWDGDSLRIRSRFDVDAGSPAAVVLTPSVVSPAVLGQIDPVTERPQRNPLVAYPSRAAIALMGRLAEQPPPEPPAPVAKLLGATRARLMLDLAEPRTTTELATRHHLAPSAVSYHLGVLHRAGLLVRVPGDGSVPYQLAAAGFVLLAAGRDQALGTPYGNGRGHRFEPGRTC